MPNTTVDAFCAAFESVSGHPRVADSLAAAAAAILSVIDASGAKCVAHAQIPASLAAAVEAGCAQRGVQVMKPPYDAATLPTALDCVNIGITGLDFGVAESGTMAEIALNDAVRLVSAMPRTYIGILRASTIVPRLMDATPRLREIFAAHDRHVTVSFISGPSRTGDIEMILTLGVHGPEHAHCVILAGEAEKELGE